MQDLISTLSTHLKQPFFKSALHTAACGILFHYMSFIAIPTMACGPGNVDAAQGVFTCAGSDMNKLFIALILGCMVIASLFLGRAADLHAKRYRSKA